MTKALVVYCHPQPNCFVSAVRDCVMAGLESGGADVRLTDLYSNGFEPELSESDPTVRGEPGCHPSLSDHATDLAWCDTLILVYPTWWAAQPAMLKGWIDRVWVEGVAWEYSTDRDGVSVSPMLHNVRQLAAVTTHGSSKLVNAIEGEGGKRTLTRSLSAMCHPKVRKTWLSMYAVDSSSLRQRQKFLGRVERRSSALAKSS